MLYQSGTILEYCKIQFAAAGITSSKYFPYVKNSIIQNCTDGLVIHYAAEAEAGHPEEWAFLDGNEIKGCKWGIRMETPLTITMHY